MPQWGLGTGGESPRGRSVSRGENQTALRSRDNSISTGSLVSISRAQSAHFLQDGRGRSRSVDSMLYTKQRQASPARSPPPGFRFISTEDPVSGRMHRRLAIHAPVLVGVFRSLKTKLVYTPHGYGLPEHDKPMYFEAPYRSLFFARDELVEHMNDTAPKSYLRGQLRRLISFIDTYFAESFVARAEQRRTGQVRFDQLWTLFPVGELVYQKDKSLHADMDIEQVSTVDVVDTDDRRVCTIDLRRCIYHKSRFYRVEFGFIEIDEYCGTKPITLDTLGLIPLKMLPEGEQQSIRTRLIKRGKAYFDLYKTPFSLWQYHGPVKLQSDFQQDILQGLTGKNPRKHNWVANERVMVDARLSDENYANTIGAGADYEIVDTSQPIPDETYLICFCQVVVSLIESRQFATRALTWLLREVEWKADPFQRVRSTQTDLVTSLLRSHDPLKHLGCHTGQYGSWDGARIFLLSGKRSDCRKFVQAVAESVQKPLFRLDMLSFNTASIINQFASELRTVFPWRGPVLIENCGEFMEQRSHRNEVVKIHDHCAATTNFRTALSTYSGIIFLLPGQLQDDMDPIFEELPMVTVEVKGVE